MDKKKEVLHTERLVLKGYEEKDTETMVELLTNEEIKKTFMIPDFENKKQAEDLFHKIRQFCEMEEHFEYGIFFEERLIGFVNDCGIDGTRIEIGYVISPQYKGRGFATEAVKACIEELFRMGFEHIQAGFFEENVASRRVMEKSGMHLIDFEEQIEYQGKMHRCLFCEIDKEEN